MAAPQSSPDLSVINEAEEAKDASTSSTPAESEATPPTAPAAASPKPARRRRAVPIWLLALVVVIGAALVVSQYQRAEHAEARVVSLTSELAAVGAELAAYQGHLEDVRSGVADLSERMDGLKTLVDADPLAPASVEESAEAGAALPPAETAAPVERPAASSESAEVIPPVLEIPEPAPPPALESGEASEILDGAISTPFTADPGYIGGYESDL